MERTLYLINAHGETITKEQINCYAQQLIKDLKTHKKIIWKRDLSANWETFCSTGLTGNSLIQLRTYRIKKQPVVVLSYEKDGKFICNALEFDGNPSEPTHFAHLYKCVSAAVKHHDIFGSMKSADVPLSVEDMDDHCLKVIDVFRSVTATQIADHLLKKPSTLSFDISQGSPEWLRRAKQIHNVVKFIQNARIKESALLLDSFALKTADGKLCGHIATDPVVRWVNAHIIIHKEKFEGLSNEDIRLKVASDIVANLLLDS